MNIYLDSENISTGGKVEFIKCSTCNFDSFKLELSADTDMVYQDVIGFINRERKELLLTHLSDEEFHNFSNYSEKQLSERVNNIFKENDFTFINRSILAIKMAKNIGRQFVPNAKAVFKRNEK